MKKIVASVGLVALGASTLHIQNAMAADESQPARPWSANVTLRGFYDDNFDTAPNSVVNGKKLNEVFGYEISPSAGLSWGDDLNTIFVNYTYDLKRYDHTPLGSGSPYDQDHLFTMNWDHTFSERYSLSVNDSFVIGQEPDILQNGTLSTFQRISGSNTRNTGGITFNAEVTPLLSFELGYNNAYYDYASKFQVVAPTVPPPPALPNPGQNNPGQAVVASPAGTLDRIENDVHIDSRWTLSPETIGVFGYQFSDINYTGNEYIGGTVPTAPPTAGAFQVSSDNRNSRSHFVYVGVDQTFNPDLSANVRVGAQYIDYYNSLVGTPNTTAITPYAAASLHYAYAPSSYAEAGLTHSRVPTDIGETDGKDFTKDIEATSVYAKLRHCVTPYLFGSVVATFQNSVFDGGGPTIDGKTEQFYTLGLDAEYDINRHFTTHLGYDYDTLRSQLSGRTYDRNRVYVGLTATY